jgi:DNA segregation ATPase FtsK/SpoIIIE, S-DNA-T family
MTTSLADAVSALQRAHGRLQGVLDAARAEADRRRNAAHSAAAKEREKQQAIARNRAAQAVAEHSLRARDIASGLTAAEDGSLAVAEYIGIGKLAVPGASSGVNEEVHAPLLIPFVGRGNIVIEAPPERAQRIIASIVWKALDGTAPGQIDLVGYDPALRGTLAPFATLRRISDDTLTVVSRPAELEQLVHQLAGDVQRVNETLRGVSHTLTEFRRGAGHPVERYRLVVLLDYPQHVDEQLHRQLVSLVRAGADAGVAFIIATTPGAEDKPEWWKPGELEGLGSTLKDNGKRLAWAAHPEFVVTIPETDAAELARNVDELVRRAASASAPKVPFERVQHLDARWDGSSADRLRFAVGLAGPSVAEITLGDEREQRHNVLITGAVGQGKSNLLKVIIHSLSQRYSPDELELYLLDFKEGVTLFPLAPTPGSPDYLPHARVLGLESDRDFGLAVLRHLEAEFARRAKLFRPYGDSISRYRAAVPEARMPRIVIVIDEFHMLFDPNDKTAETAAQLLEAIARRGRSYGVHLILASQTVSGISALMTREGGIFAQFPIRLALKNAVQESYATLGQGNDAAARLRVRGEAVLNLDYGHIDGNRQLVVAAADDKELARLRQQWWLASRETTEPPLVFDGSRLIRASDAVGPIRGLRTRAGGGGGGGAVALIGYPIDVTGRPMGIPLGAEPGRNLAVLGAGEPGGADPGEEPANNAIGVLQTAALSLALQHPDGEAEFVSIEALDEATFERNGHRLWLAAMERVGYAVHRVGRSELSAYLQGLAAELETREADAPPRYLLGYGLDRATALDTPDMFAHKPSEDLQQLLRAGPAKRLHLLGWWANAATFRSHIGYGGEGFIDALLMLRLDQSTVQELLSPFITWQIRDNRGLLSDRTQLPEPITIIPFAPLTPREASALDRTDWEA